MMLGAGGTATLNVNKTNFSNISLLKPTNEILDKFLERVSVYFELMEINSKQQISLEILRDTLLPCLMSGELSVEGMEG